jgi:hypothetical protein
VSGWTPQQLAALAGDDELGIASRRPDGTLRPFITIWFVTHGGDLYVRSAHGPENGWYRRALASGTGRVRVRGLERDVTFNAPDHGLDAALHAAYESKYVRYARGIVRTVVSPEAAGATLRLDPADSPPGG